MSKSRRPKAPLHTRASPRRSSFPDTPGKPCSHAKEIRRSRAARPLVVAAAPRGDALYMVGALALSSAFFQFFSAAPPVLRHDATNVRKACPANRFVNQISTIPHHPEQGMFHVLIGLDLPQRPAAIRTAELPADLKFRRHDALYTDIRPFFAMIGTH